MMIFLDTFDYNEKVLLCLINKYNDECKQIEIISLILFVFPELKLIQRFINLYNVFSSICVFIPLCFINLNNYLFRLLLRIIN